MVEIFRTDDGSRSLKDQRTSETYHSDKGAVQESLHVYIGTGLLHQSQRHAQLNILEMGFGTGLNALLTFLHLPANVRVKYTALEAYPLSKEILEQLEYEKFLGIDHEPVHRIIQAPFDTTTSLHQDFSLTKIKTDFTSFETSARFDLIYYDAFGPKIQPELWTLACMEKCARWLNPGGTLVTYCSQGQFRRNLKAAGFSVEKLPGPPGKREITRATKI